jgi:hypothetical protein
MELTQEFLRHVTECEQMAKSSRDLESKATWRRMADRWRRCADILVREDAVRQERAKLRQERAKQRHKRPAIAA